MTNIGKNMAAGAVVAMATAPILCGAGYGALGIHNANAAIDKACANGLATAKGIALFFAAPFVGLAYILAFPFVGLGVAAWLGGKALLKFAAVRNAAGVAKKIGMVLVTPLLGLAFVVLLPWIGAAMLVWVGGRAVVR